MKRSTHRALLLGSLLAGSACGGQSGEPGDSTDVPFLAFASNFRGFRAWTSFDTGAGSTPIDNAVHTTGPRTTYVNQVPPAGASAFPKSTILVKVMSGDKRIFASVKRGAGYNPNGARGWEWFELEEIPGTADVKIIWHGVGPPAGEMYGGDAGGACNTCHGAAAANDYVLTPALRLSEKVDASHD